MGSPLPIDKNMAGELQPVRFFSCRGVSFEINGNNSNPPSTTVTNINEEAHDANLAAGHPRYYWRRYPTFPSMCVYDVSSSKAGAPTPLPAESVVESSSSSCFFSKTQSRVGSSHFYDVDIEDEKEEYEYLPSASTIF